MVVTSLSPILCTGVLASSPFFHTIHTIPLLLDLHAPIGTGEQHTVICLQQQQHICSHG